MGPSNSTQVYSSKARQHEQDHNQVAHSGVSTVRLIFSSRKMQGEVRQITSATESNSRNTDSEEHWENTGMQRSGHAFYFYGGGFI